MASEASGHIFDETGIRIKDDYRQAIADWPPLEDRADLDQFLGLVNYFKNWIDKYAETCAPLNALRKKGTPWEWTPEREEAVRKLKSDLMSAPVLHYFRPELETIVHTDSSAFAIGGWIGQVDKSGGEHPVVFWSRKMKDPETRSSCS